MTHPRRQQYRQLAASVGYAVAAVAALLAAAAIAGAGRLALAGPVLAAGAALVLAARHARRLAARNRVGADSEADVARALSPLAADGWSIAHSVSWPGGGDIDHLLRSPGGVGFAIETKTRGFTIAQLERTLHTARWAARRRGQFPRGVIPVLCVVRNRQLEHLYGQVLVVSLDRLVPALRSRSERPVQDAGPGGLRARALIRSGV